MRIVVSGTHASGKSTLISDFAARHPEYDVFPDPFDLVDETWDAPGAAMFAAQLRISADRLLTAELAPHVIAERGPLDFLAYLSALETLGGASGAGELHDRALHIARDALQRVDLLVVLPLRSDDHIIVGADEHPQLRDAMNDALLDLVDDPDLVGDRVRVIELVGDRSERLSALEAAAVSR